MQLQYNPVYKIALLTFKSYANAAFNLSANGTIQVVLMNMYTGTVEQRCVVIRTRGCYIQPYDLDSAAAYAFYATMTNTLDPVHYIFNASFTGM